MQRTTVLLVKDKPHIESRLDIDNGQVTVQASSYSVTQITDIQYKTPIQHID